MSSFITTRPFPCRQCLFCKEASRIDGGCSGVESFNHGGWFCSGTCLQLANLFSSEPGKINNLIRDSLINTYNKCYTKTYQGDKIHIPRLNAEKVNNEVKCGDIYLIKSQYEHTTDGENFNKYD